MTQIFRTTKPRELRKAGPTDLLELAPVPGGTPVFVVKWLAEAMVAAITHAELIHISGPTGSAKTSFIEALHLGAGNFHALCRSLGIKPRPMRLYPIEMAVYETPGELYQRRALRDGKTYDEPSQLVSALASAIDDRRKAYPVVWLREMGRVHAANVQGGLLDLMVRGDVVLPGGRRLHARGISWVADSNYQAETESTHTLVTLDDALKRRFTVNLSLDYLPPDQEMTVVARLAEADAGGQVDTELVSQVVRLGAAVRRHRREGNLLSLTPPTIYGYTSFLRLARALPHVPPQQIAMVTLLGNASAEDRKFVAGVMQEIYGLGAEIGDPAEVGNLF